MNEIQAIRENEKRRKNDVNKKLRNQIRQTMLNINKSKRSIQKLKEELRDIQLKNTC